MPTSLPRVQVAFPKATFEILEKISAVENDSLSHIVSRLVQYAIDMSEDLSLGQIAQQRGKTFRRDDALTSEEILKWNKNRKKE